MKNKLINSYFRGKFNNAFTLIELLAIIVILAIIAVITIPIILNVVDNAKRGSVIDSAHGYKDAIQKFYVQKLYEDQGFELDGTYMVSNLKGMGLTVDGSEPTDDSWVAIRDDEVYDFSLKFDDYVANYDVLNQKIEVIKNGTIDLTPEEEQNRIDNVKLIVSAYIEEALNTNNSLTSETVKLVSEMTDVVIEDGPVDGWVHFIVTDEGLVVKDYSLKVDNYIADYSSTEADNIIVTKNGTIRNKPIVRTVVRTIDGVGYYNTEWIGINPVYYNPVAGEGCTSYHEDNSKTGYNGLTTNGSETDNTDNNNGCLKWYAYSENADGTVNLLLDHNTTARLKWNSTASNISGPSTEGDKLLGKLQSDTSGWASTLSRNDSYSMKVEKERNPIDYTIDYTGYKARLITSQEIAYITGNESWDETIVPSGGWSAPSNWFYYETHNKTEPATCKAGVKSGCLYGWLYDRTSPGCSTHFGCLNNADVDTYGYWTATADAKESQFALYVTISNYIAVNNVTSSYGLRPIITVSKSDVF